jgi:Recombination endonuclease VII
MRKGYRKTHCKRGHPRTPENLSGKKGCCKPCARLRDKVRDKERKGKWERDHPEKAKAKDFRRRGWTPESLEKTKEEQNNLCAICEKPFTGSYDSCGDHEHTVPPKPRGILCRNCNSGLGMFQDSPEICEKAAIYLRKWGTHEESMPVRSVVRHFLCTGEVVPGFENLFEGFVPNERVLTTTEHNN